MRTITSRLLVAASAAVLATTVAAPIHAQSAFPRRVPVAAAVTFDTVKVSQARALLARAEQYWNLYEIELARRDFAQATDIMRDQNVYAAPALVLLAQATYASGAAEQAALELIGASQEAARFGDQELQITSLYEASLVYAELGNMKEAKSILADVKRLLAQSHLPSSVKAQLEYRIEMGE